MIADRKAVFLTGGCHIRMHMLDMPAIEVIGALCPERAIGSGPILAALSGSPELLTHGGRFTGRPLTRVFCAAGLVVKLRGELHYSRGDARHWIEGTLQKERRLAVHHPEKTWFMLLRAGEPVIANAAPLLTPLHQLGPINGHELVPLLCCVVDRCIEVGARHQLRLDEGLSNFGLGPDGKVYYLDDDSYPWDDFLGLAEMLGVWTRQLQTLDADGGRALGEHLRKDILREFADPRAAWVLAQNLRCVLAVTDRQSAVREACVAAIAAPSPACR